MKNPEASKQPAVEEKNNEPVQNEIFSIRKSIRRAVGKVYDFFRRGWNAFKSFFSSEDTPPIETPSARTFERQYGQWHLAANDNGYSISNPSPEGKKRFYEVKSGEKYNNPIIVAEPDLAFEPPKGVDYVDSRGKKLEPPEKIAGVCCEDGPRFSLSSPEAPKFTMQEDGTMQLDGKTWYPTTLFSKDKNRIKNYDAYFTQKAPLKAGKAKVVVKELAEVKELYNHYSEAA